MASSTKWRRRSQTIARRLGQLLPTLSRRLPKRRRRWRKAELKNSTMRSTSSRLRRTNWPKRSINRRHRRDRRKVLTRHQRQAHRRQAQVRAARTTLSTLNTWTSTRTSKRQLPIVDCKLRRRRRSNCSAFSLNWQLEIGNRQSEHGQQAGLLRNTRNQARRQARGDQEGLPAFGAQVSSGRESG